MDSEELEELVVKTARLAEENHRMLRRVERARRRETFFRFIHWAVIIGGFLLVYYFLQPYIAEMQAVIESYRTTIEEAQSEAAARSALDQFLDSFDTAGGTGAGNANEGGQTLPETSGEETIQ